MQKLWKIFWYSVLKVQYSYRHSRATNGQTLWNGPVGKRPTPSPSTSSGIPDSIHFTATTTTPTPVNPTFKGSPSSFTTRAAFVANRCMVRILLLTSTSRRMSFPSEFSFNNNVIMTILFEMFKAKNSFISTLNDFTIISVNNALIAFLTETSFTCG